MKSVQLYHATRKFEVSGGRTEIRGAVYTILNHSGT